MISVRRATAADAHAIAEVQVTTWRSAYSNIFPAGALESLTVEEREPMWRRFAEMDALSVFVAEIEGEVVGFVNVGESRDVPGEGELYAIYVRPERWGSGAGRALMDVARDSLGERYSTAVLWVFEDNPRARRFYEREGWVADDRRTEVIRGVELVEVRYRLSGLERR